MATYAELYNLQFVNGALFNRIVVAVMVAANGIGEEAGGTVNHIERVVWAKEAIADPRAKANDILALVLGINKGVDKADLLNSSDSAVQANVDSVIDFLAV